MLGCDALNMDMNGFSIQFRYKPLIILKRPHAKSRGKKFRPPHLGKKKLPASYRGKKIDQHVGQEKIKLISQLATK